MKVLGNSKEEVIARNKAKKVQISKKYAFQFAKNDIRLIINSH